MRKILLSVPINEITKLKITINKNYGNKQLAKLQLKYHRRSFTISHALLHIAMT